MVVNNSPMAALEDALEPKTGGFTFPTIPGGNVGGPPSRSFLTTNTATAPDRLGTNQFIPNDYGAAMRQMQGDGSSVAPPATGGFDQSRMTVNSAASATGSMGSPPSTGGFDQSRMVVNRANQQPSMFDQFFREADAGTMRSPDEYRAMGFANQVDYTGMPTVEGDGTGVTNVGTGAFDPQSYEKLGINDQTTERAKAVANQFATRANPVIKKQFATKAVQPGADKTATEAQAAGTDITTRQANVGADKTASSLGSFGRGVKTPYTALGLEDNLQVGTGDVIGSDSVDAGADMVQRELLNRSLSNTLINPTDTLATSAEANVLNRLSGNQLSDSTAIDEALAAAQVRLADSGVGLGGDLVTNAEQVIQDRLMGGTNPLIEQQRADFLRRSDQQQDQLREQLNRLGVLRSGDTAEAFGDFIGARERTLNDIDARAYDLQSQALADALNFQGRRDSLGLANENLARAAIGDVAGLAGQIDDRKALQAGLAGDAVSQALGLQGRRDQLDIAGSELRRQAQQDVFGRQAQLSGLETDRINRQIARDQANRAERGLRSDLVTAEQQRRLAGVADQRASEALASSLTSEDLQRQLAIAGDVRAADALGSSLTTERLERLLATAADTREAEALGSRLTSEQLERQLATASDARAAEALGSDLTTQAQQRRLASAADARAAQGLGSDLTTQLLQRQLALAGDARAADALSSDLTTQNLLRNLQVNEDLRERQALGDTFATTAQQRQLASAADQRAQRALNQNILDQQLQRDLAGRADIRAGEALESDLDTAELQRRLAQAEVTGRFDTGAANQAPLATLQSRALDSDLATQRQQRELARVSDLRAGRALDADIAAQNLQNRLAQSAVTGEFQTGANRAPISTLAQQQFDLQRQLALSGDERAQQQLESALFGAVEGEDGRQQTLTGRAFDADVASQNLQNRLAEAGVTGQFQRGANMPAEQTLQAQLAQQDIESAIQNRAIQQAADARADRALGADISAQNFQNRLAQAGLTGELDFGGSRPAQQTLQAQAQFDAAERADRALDADIAAQNLQNRLAQAAVTGQLEFGGSRRPEQTLQAQALLQDIASQESADARADRALSADISAQNFQNRLAQAGLTGELEFGGSRPAQRTIQRELADQQILDAVEGRGRAERALRSDINAQALQNRLAEADVTGDFFARGMGGPATRTLRAQALDQDIAASQGAESRAERAIQDALFGEVEGYTTLTGEAAERAETGFDREMRDRDIVQALALGKDGYYSTPGRAAILDRLLNDSDLRRNIYTDDPAGVDLPGSPDPPPRTTPVAGQAGTRMDEEGNLYRLSPDGLEWIRV
tara:strand:+ start:1031 stop:5008 length:3978 start_codon:yes stop_codon:yes gene_type:complete